MRERIRILITSTLIFTTVTTGCATAHRNRFLVGSASAGAIGAGGGAVLSPNSESRGLNALVFGLTGALFGGLGSLLFNGELESPKQTTTEKKESPGNEIVIPSDQKNLPAFVRERLKPVVVEELREPDTVSEDGSLHEPHRVYRIKRQAELFARPIQKSKSSQEKSQ